MGLGKTDLAALRTKIAELEKRPQFSGDAVSELVARQAGRAEQTLPHVPPGVLHEIFTDEQRHCGSALGFALGLARESIGGGRTAIIHLQLASEMRELGLPYALGLKSFGIDPDRMVIGRIETLPELLWAMEEAIACRAVAAVVADIAGHPKALDFTVSRRLSLRAAAAGTSTFLIRYGRDREASAAKLRWRISPHRSAGQAFDAHAPGPPRFAVDIEKYRLGSRTERAEGKSMIVDWTEHGFVAPEKRQGIRVRGATPLPGALPPAMGDRLSEAS